MVEPEVKRGRPRTPWAQAIMVRVSRGPVEYIRLVYEAAALVPPGRAYRHQIDYLRSLAEKAGREYVEPISERDKDSVIRSGQSLMAKQCINGMAYRKQIVLYSEDGTRMVRQP